MAGVDKIVRSSELAMPMVTPGLGFLIGHLYTYHCTLFEGRQQQIYGSFGNTLLDT